MVERRYVAWPDTAMPHSQNGEESRCHARKSLAHMRMDVTAHTDLEREQA